MKTLKQAILLLATVALASCGGGGGNAGTSVFGGGTPTTPTSSAASIDVIASGTQVPSGGDQVTVTATVKDSGNVGLAAAPITFASDSGNLTSATAVTDATGVATVILTAGSNRSNRNIVVSATSGSAVGTITLPVSGTTVVYQGATTVALGGKITPTVLAKDSKGAPISGLAVTVTSSLNNGLSSATLTTDSTGSAALTYTGTNSGTDSLVISGGGLSFPTAITVSAENFLFVSPAAATAIPVGTKQPVTVQYLSNGVAQPNKTVAFTATAGLITVADASSNPCTSASSATTTTTDSNGKATVCVGSTTASPATVQATLIGAGTTAQATLPINFVAVTPAKVVLQVTPTALSPNASGSTTQQASVQATVTDAIGNPVSGVTVDFNRVTDPSGGNLSQASAVTSSSGQATVQYIAGATTTANNGVVLQATVEGAPLVPPGSASLTVTQSALFIALGTGNTVIALDSQTLQKDWTVYVTDSNGVPVSNVSLTIKALPVAYRKGSLIFATVWGYDLSSLSTCNNEDANYNGVLDPGEDFNNDGILEPGNVISVTTSSTSGASSGTVTTGSTGRATISLVYAKSYALWVDVKLVASAVVTGTESSTQAVFYAPGLASDYSTATVAPPGQTSPFGTNSCALPN
jgi:Bacterial Ig-like domain (group 1)